MVVEREGPADVAPAHELEARVVHQRDIAGAAQRGVECGAVEVGIDPGDGEDREDLIAQSAYRLEAATSLRERDRLDQDMVMGEEPLARVLKPGEDLPGTQMTRILFADQRVERRGVDEDGYEP